MDPSDLPSECDENMLKAVARGGIIYATIDDDGTNIPRTDPHKIRSCRGGLHGIEVPRDAKP
jgi:hypothetical protein